MKVQQIHKTTFKNGSKTYFNSSIFFPKRIRDRVFILYAFVRTADNYVDCIPQDAEEFYRFRESYRAAVNGCPAGNPVIDEFVLLSRDAGFEQEWTEAFLASMEMDLKKQRYNSLPEVLEYIYGSAEVIGLFMAALMDLDPASRHSARMLGRSMQYINFIRDIAEDLEYGRQYLPAGGYDLPSLSQEDAAAHREQFTACIRGHIRTYHEWRKEAEQGFTYIPLRYLIPIKTASDMYKWTAEEIYKDPFIVYKKKVKPKKTRIYLTIAANTLLLAGKTGWTKY